MRCHLWAVAGLIAELVSATPNGLFERDTCNHDLCYRAVVANTGTRASDCASFLAKTVAPCGATVTSSSITTITASTITQTVPATVTITLTVGTSTPTVTVTSESDSTETDTITSTLTSTYISTSTVNSILTTTVTAAQKRDLRLEQRAEASVCPATSSASAVPAYASPCSGVVRYSSACSCFGFTAQTTTLPATATSTVTSVSTVSATATTTVTSTATSTISVTAIADPSTVTVITSATTTTLTTALTTQTVTSVSTTTVSTTTTVTVAPSNPTNFFIKAYSTDKSNFLGYVFPVAISGPAVRFDMVLNTVNSYQYFSLDSKNYLYTTDGLGNRHGVFQDSGYNIRASSSFPAGSSYSVTCKITYSADGSPTGQGEFACQIFWGDNLLYMCTGNDWTRLYLVKKAAYLSPSCRPVRLFLS